MNFQNLLVGAIILLAAIYIGANIRRKIRSFSPKDNSCGNDCGCGTSSKPNFDANR